MKITRENYEIYFIDFFDGKLSQEEVEELLLFLNWNQDLKIEFDSFEQLNISPVKHSFDKSSIYKSDQELPRLVNDENFNNSCIAFYEGDLSSAEDRDLKHYISVYPEKEKEYKLFGKARLMPDASIKFDGKTGLKKFRITKVNTIWRIAAGASVAAVIAFLIYFGTNPVNDSKTNLLSDNNKKVESHNNKKEEDFSLQKSTVPAVELTANRPQQKNDLRVDVPEVEKKTNSENADVIDYSDNPKKDFEAIAFIESKKPILKNEEVIIGTEDIAIRKAEFPTVRTIVPPGNNSLLANLLKKTGSNLLKKVATPASEDNNRRLKFTENLIAGFNKITGRNVRLVKNYDSDGTIKSLVLRSENLSITASVK